MIHFDSKVWAQKYISNKHDTAWRCGRCGVGGIKLSEKINTKRSSYAVHAICTDSHCRKRYSIIGEIVFMAGETKVSKEYLRIDDIRLYPTQFQPELVMFPLPLKMNEAIKLLLIKSFNHFWYDLDACANKIRQGIELIMDEKSAVGENLDQKIRSKKKELGVQLTDKILALKWIGNDGSHASRPFEKQELFDTYALLVDVLNHLYPDESERERRENLVQLINTRRSLKRI